MMRARRPWPVPTDTALDRSRAIARSLLAALEQADPAAAQHATELAESVGETWLIARPDTGGRRLTVQEAAQLVGRQAATIRQWCSRGTAHGRLTRHPDGIDEHELLDLDAAMRRPITHPAQLPLPEAPA